MDEALNHILEGCKLARDLETSIRQGYHINPNFLLKSSEEIVAAFNTAMSSFNSPNSSLPVSSNMVVGENSSHGTTSFFQALNIVNSGGFDQQTSTFFDHAQLEGLGLEMLPNVSTVATPAMEIGGGSGYGNVFEATNAEDGGTRERVRGTPDYSSGSGRRLAGSSGQRSNRRRRDNGERVTQQVPAVRTGNTEMPPDDGYTWRKYGQKDILGCRFPRSYFRCTHKNYYGCEAKKQVQRLDEDPYTYEIVYCGRHTCLTSTTPLLLSSLAPATTAMTSVVAPMITTAIASTSNVTSNPHIESSIIGATMPEIPPSTSIQLGSWINREYAEGRPVSDMADVLFNSGSSSSSMDAIFYSKPEN